MISIGNRLLFAGMLMAGPMAFGQQTPLLTPPEESFVFRSDTRLVVCHTTVTDHSGHLVTNLPQNAFTVQENGVRQQLKTFKREDVPVAMGLVIDNSASMISKRRQVETASLAMVQASNPQDQVFVVNFNDQTYLDLPSGVDFTSDLRVLEQALRRIDARGGTAMRDAIQMSVQHLKKSNLDKKVLVVITDGNDNYSSVTLDELVRTAQQSGVLIYSIGLLADEDPKEAHLAKQALEKLAQATGGAMFSAKDVQDVSRLSHQVAQDIRNQYIIQYTPANQVMDGKFRAIRISVKASGVAVRTRPGYWATAADTSAGR